MGDWFQSMVSKKSEVDNPEALASKIVTWLVQQGIVEARQIKCTPGETRLGYPPGPNYVKVVDKSQSEFDLRLLIANGLICTTRKTVFNSGQGKTEVRCPKCKAICKNDWTKAIDSWYVDGEKGLMVCPECRNFQSITEWDFEPKWGFSNLGFTFWNWPKVNDKFVLDFSEKLGQPVILVMGKL
jgi:hypothetical protein